MHRAQKPIAESEWKRFKKVRPRALDRFCRMVLSECGAICNGDSRTAHERYLELYGHVQDRNREMIPAFDDFRRTTALQCLVDFHRMGLLKDDEIAEFSDEVQRTLEYSKDS